MLDLEGLEDDFQCQPVRSAKALAAHKRINELPVDFSPFDDSQHVDIAEQLGEPVSIEVKQGEDQRDFCI